MSILLEGNKVRDEILAESKVRVESIVAKKGRPPGLAVVLVGQDPASEIYVRNKVKASRDIGVYSEQITPPDDISTEDLLGIVEGLNQRSEIDGILVQLPVPKQIDARRILQAVSPDKDVDGFHPLNVGRLSENAPGSRPCTPAGVMEMLRRYKIPIAGKRAVIVGRSDIVGKPMAMLLLHANATVTICHSKTVDLAGECRRAEILVAAIGRPAFVTADFISPEATVIDVGINRIKDRAQVAEIFRGSEQKLAAFDRNGSLVVGDAHPLDVQKAAAYTPVPGGVGPLTIAMLMSNTIDSAERRLGLCSALH